MPRKFARSVRHAGRGFVYVWREERNFRIQCVLSCCAIIAMLWIGFSMIETAIMVLAMAGVLGAEIINTFMEDLLDVLQPARDPRVGKVKDMLAAIVMLMSGSAALVGLIIVWRHFS